MSNAFENFNDDLSVTLGTDSVAIDVTLRDPVQLPWGVQLRGYSLMLGREGILMGQLELSELESLLSVSPESLVAPS